MKTCVVSFADGGQNGEYQRKLKRLEQSLKGNFDGDFLGFTDYKEIGSPTHKEIPYAFKPYSIQKAIDSGYELVLWADSPIVAIKPLQGVFEYLEEFGFMFFDNIGHPLGRWCNDRTLAYFALSRERAMNIKQVMACVHGWNFTVPFYSDIFKDYYKLAEPLYPGSWDDHRHDQSVLSCLLDLYGLPILTAHETFFAYEHFKDVPGWKIADSVCLVSK